MDDFDLSTSQQVEFIDYRAINWRDVRRTRCQFYQRFHYEYPGLIHNLKQRLVIVPAERYGAQQLRGHTLTVSPTPVASRQIADRFGNRVLELEVPQADRFVSFEVWMVVERETHDGHGPVISPDEVQYFLEPTRLTTPDRHIRAIARRLQAETSTPLDLARRITAYVYGAMRYKWGITTVATPAAEALKLGQGLCQDYAHIMLAICRAAGLPARYVSGHMLGEGGSHAWVEVILPADRGLVAVAFDPTNNRQPHLGYVTVAVGRDYSDVSPTSGSYTAPYSGRLTCSKRAGLTLVEYHNGHTLQSPATP